MWSKNTSLRAIRFIIFTLTTFLFLSKNIINYNCVECVCSPKKTCTSQVEILLKQYTSFFNTLYTFISGWEN